MAPPSAAIALRESFGDRKLPGITRKITACVACRKLKIKCHMNESKPPCSRCKARRLPCTVNKSIQMLLENDASWKEIMEQRIDKIEKSLISSEHSSSSKSSTDFDLLGPPSPEGLTKATTSKKSRGTLFQEPPAITYDITLNLSCSLGGFPASSMNNFALDSQGAYPGLEQDLISRGLISQDTAEEFFKFYHKNLDPYIHSVLAEDDCLALIRSRSSLLMAAICTSAAFCIGSKDYQACFNRFTHEISGKMFSTHPTFDDVRALCIGAFWLNDISSALNALAVRMAAELDLHRCITKMPHTKRECYDRTRLYFLVYICDHHCSLSHGRPPMTRELGSLKPARALLRSEFSTLADLKLISQVELWSISSRVFDAFGADIGSPLVLDSYAKLEHLSSAYNRWRHEWLVLLTLRHALDRFSRHIFDLYFYSANLYLFSHVFRGAPQKDLEAPVAMNGMHRLASCAVDNALSIVQCAADENEARAWLGKLPSYFGTTIAFASVFLLRASWYGQPIYNVDKDEVFQCLRRLTEVLREPSVVIHPTHLLLRIANSLEIAVGGLCQNDYNQVDGKERHDLADPRYNFNLLEDDLNMGFTDSWMAFPDSTLSGFPLANSEESFVQ